MHVLTIRFKGCIVNIDDDALYLETVFPDGAKDLAVPVWDRDRPMASRLGYGNDDSAIIAMWRHHDPLHSLIAECMGRDYSDTLWGVAHGKYAPAEIWQAEERRVLALQTLLSTGRNSNDLDDLWRTGESPHTITKRVRELIYSREFTNNATDSVTCPDDKSGRRGERHWNYSDCQIPPASG